MFWKSLSIMALLSCFLFALAIGFSCGGDDDDDDDDNDDDDNDDDDDASSLDFVTYNIGMARGYVPYATERFPEIRQALQTVDADVMCLQEVWNADDISAVSTDLDDEFPNMYRYDSSQDFDDIEPGPPACDDLSDLRACAEANCDGLPTDELAACILSNCVDEIGALTDDCFSCLAANIGQEFDTIEEICTSPSLPPITYGASNGLLLFANQELTDTERLQLDFFLTVRVVLYAKMQTGNGPVHLFCTHLTAGLSDLPYNGDYESYEEEQAAQVTALLDFVETKAGGEPAVLMGDFNTGPDTADLDGEFPDNYDTLIADGLYDPYLELLPDQCTWCGDNPLTGGGSSSVIDHVFFKDFADETQYSAMRILDEQITFESDGEDINSRLSDHYGAKITTTW